MRMYRQAWSSTSAGVPISSSMGAARDTPMTSTRQPKIRLARMEVCTDSRRALVSPAP